MNKARAYLAPYLQYRSKLHNRLRKTDLRVLKVIENSDNLYIESSASDLDENPDVTLLGKQGIVYSYMIDMSNDVRFIRTLERFRKGEYTKMYSANQIRLLFPEGKRQYHVLMGDEGMKEQHILQFYDSIHEAKRELGVHSWNDIQLEEKPNNEDYINLT